VQQSNNLDFQKIPINRYANNVVMVTVDASYAPSSYKEDMEITKHSMPGCIMQSLVQKNDYPPLKTVCTLLYGII